jgi:hypothetical protein
LWNAVNEVATQPESYEYARIDLCFQFSAYVRDFIRAHQTSRYPLIRRLPVNYFDQTLTWGIGKCELRCLAYDKAREMNNSLTKGAKLEIGKVVRVEFQLRGRRLRREFGTHSAATGNLSFDTCYSVARRLALLFSSRTISKPTRIAEFLSIAQREEWHCNGVSAFDLYTDALSTRQTNRLRQNMAKCRVKTFDFDWNAMLPESPLSQMLIELVPKNPARQ